MRYYIVFLTLMTFFPVPLVCAKDYKVVPDGPSLDIERYSMTFEDNFSKPDVAAKGPFAGFASSMRWTAHTPWNGDFGDARFANPGPSGPFKFGPDGLSITASKDSTGKWQSGLICSVDKDGVGQQGFLQKYGYFEMRALLPAGAGTWPAFWLIGADKSHGSAEIDVLEYYGQFTDSFRSTLHLWKEGDQYGDGYIVQVPDRTLVSAFHTYGVEVDDKQISFYFDRRRYLVLPTQEEFRQPMYIMANLALGGGWPIDKLSSPLSMTISYIRAYRLKSE